MSRENLLDSEALKYLKAFLWATIDPDDLGRDIELYEANPHIQFIFTLKPDGIISDRTITGGQIRRAIELVGADKLRIRPSKQTITDEILKAKRDLADANEMLEAANAAAASFETRALKAEALIDMYRTQSQKATDTYNAMIGVEKE